MYPYLRLRRLLRAARRADPLPVDGVDVIRLRCWPWDIDPFWELNNGRTLTLFDLGRFALAERIGLAAAMRRHRWGLAVAGASVRYRRRIRAFDRIEMRTRSVGWDARWFYLAQSMRVRGEEKCALLVRTCVTEGGRMIPTERVAHALTTPERRDPPDWVGAWIAADDLRPWPPEP